MALNDIFHVQLHFENPTGSGSMGYYLKETQATTDEDPCRTIADKLHGVIGDEVLAALSDDWFWAGVEVNKVHGDPRPMYLRETAVASLSAGKIAGPGLPANNSIQFNLFQDTFGAQHHGRMNMPGIPESKASGGRLDTAYLVTEVAALAAVLALTVNDIPSGGVWDVGVISAKQRDVALPAKDWLGAFAPIISIEPTSIISRQKRRTTKARGFATTA